MRYNITGEPMPVVICDMDANESMITEKGSMVWMSPNMEMQTGAGGASARPSGGCSPASPCSKTPTPPGAVPA